MMCTYERTRPNKQKILGHIAFVRSHFGEEFFICCVTVFFGKAARGTLQDFKRERPTSRFAAL